MAKFSAPFLLALFITIANIFKIFMQKLGFFFDKTVFSNALFSCIILLMTRERWRPQQICVVWYIPPTIIEL